MIKNYYKPTPKKWRQLGDALLAVSVAITTGGLLAFDNLSTIFTPHELKVIIGCAFAFGVIGKFLTNFFKTDTKE